MPLRDVIGHRELVMLVSRAVARETVPPSLILAGPEGVGKRRVALALAQAVNCRAPRRANGQEAPSVESHATLEHDACGRCDACQRIDRLVHADLLVIVPGSTGSIRVDQVREAIERSAYRPFEGRRRVVVIDDADQMVPEAQNALLKTLEEPPPASLFVLVTARPDVLLPTVRSRCPRLRFGRLSAGEIVDALVTHHGYVEADARAAAASAEGSLGQALRVQSKEFARARETARRLLEGAAEGRVPRHLLERATELVPRRAAAKTPSAVREETAVRLRALVSLLRDLQVLSTRADEGLLTNTDLRTELEALVQFYDGDRVIRAFSAVSRALVALDRNASPKIVADWLVFQL